MGNPEVSEESHFVDFMEKKINVTVTRVVSDVLQQYLEEARRRSKMKEETDPMINPEMKDPYTVLVRRLQELEEIERKELLVGKDMPYPVEILRAMMTYAAGMAKLRDSRGWRDDAVSFDRVADHCREAMRLLEELKG